MEEYIIDCEMRALSPETIRSAKSNLRTIAGFLDKNGIRFQDADKESLKQVLAHLRNKREVVWKTQKHYFSDLSSFYDYLVYEQKAKANPVPPFRKRYLNNYKNGDSASQRKLLSVPEMEYRPLKLFSCLFFVVTGLILLIF